MEDNYSNKRREGGGGLPPMNSTDGASIEPHSARRRGGGMKRKSNNSSSLNNLSSAMFNSTPSKRFMREKASLASIHNGPFTRASAASASSAAPEVSVEPVDLSVKVEDESNVSEEWKALENEIEAEFEVVRSRGAGVHVVPNHCGWFSWTKHHPLEEQALSSFFDGKSENRTPSVYMEIRNWIVKRFHSNPNKLIEIKDLEDLDIGDSDARQEVLEFLDYWGLINFHPFPQTPVDLSDANTDGKESDKSNDLAEKIFRFETIQWCPPVVQKALTPTPLTPKVAEPPIPDEPVKPEGPSVEYHCNSCSTDCSRKRYHCQKQADFDLCTECFNNGKFGSDMSLSDFILMEPAEAPGLSSGTWTDQETLLLLEALELYKENWNEIAEHVATKTKNQCILHFVQMPIEDSFLDSDVDAIEDHRESEDIGLTNSIMSVTKGPESTDGKHCGTEDQPPSCIEKSKPEEQSEDKGCHEDGESVALKALREAFEAVGSLPEPGFEPTFANAGSPVMAMAVFLARFVGSDAATASSRSSLKVLSGNSPSIELATRHCFVLEDPPSDFNDLVVPESVAFDEGGHVSQNDGKMESMPTNPEAEDLSGDLKNHKTNENVKEDSSILPSPNGIGKDNSNTSKETGKTKVGKRAKKSRRENSGNEGPKESIAGSVIALSETASKDLNLIGSDKNNSGITTVDDSVDKNRNAEDLVEKTAVEDHVKETLKKKDTAEAALIKEDYVENHDKLLPPSSVEGSRDEAGSPMKPSNVIDDTGLTPNSNPDVSGSREGDAIKTEVQNSGQSKESIACYKVKRAAITTLAAAAVKAQLLADHEEEEIKKLAVFLIDKQLRKLEIKMALFEELGTVTMRVKEQLDRTRKKLYQERAQIIAARLGLSSSHPRPMSSSMPHNRNAINLANSGPRPTMGQNSMRPPFGRPTMPFVPAQMNPLPPATMGHNSFRPQSQNDVSSFRMK